VAKTSRWRPTRQIKVTPLNEAAQIMPIHWPRTLATRGFFVVNVSSPNTPNLRQLRTSPHSRNLAALQQDN